MSTDESKLKSETTKSKSPKKTATTDSNGNDKDDMKRTTLQLLRNSNLTLFDWCKNKYRCFFCRELFLDTALLKEHSKTHDENEMQTQIFKYNVKNYYRAELTNLKCNRCQKTMENLTELTQHLASTHAVDFKTPENLLMPYKLTDLTCQLCQQEFQSFVVLDHHMSSHYSKYVCDTCGKGFRQKYCLTSHLVTHVKKKFECRKCNATFDNYYRKRKHDVTEHRICKKFNSCPHCPEKFIHYPGRLKHLIKVHGYKRPEFKCPTCDKVYINNALLRSHIRNVHLQERNFECNICQNKYLWKCELTDHMKSHVQSRDFVCTYCGKGFFRRRNLNEHLAIHVEEFRHVCAVCGKSFAQKYNMKMHMRRCQESKKK